VTEPRGEKIFTPATQQDALFRANALRIYRIG
jgi:hypothetical protein